MHTPRRTLAVAHSHTLQDQLGSLCYQYAPATIKAPHATACSAACDAPIITLINGYSRSHKDFKLWQRKLCAAGYGVLTLDNRGSGASSASRPFHFEQFVSDIQQLWQQLNIERSHVLGISMGGLIAQLLALHHPRSLLSLILVSTLAQPQYFTPLHPPKHPSQQPLWHPASRYFSPAFAQRYPLMVKMLEKELERHQDNPQLLKQLKYQREAFAQVSYAKLQSAKIHAPTLIIHGTQDCVIRPEAAHHLASLLPRSQLNLYAGSGHLLLAEQPQKLYEDVLQFIQNQP